ncbi:MAG: hypothetical protein MPI82_03840 [Nitrosopumilus sp.]|nr:hypothetical protein [Nitrosopumilus sp.]
MERDDRYGRVEDLPASVVRRSRIGYNLEESIREVISAPCRIIDADIDLAMGVISLDLEIGGPDGAGYIDGAELRMRDGRAELEVSRSLPAPGAGSVERAMKEGAAVPLSPLEGSDPRLDIREDERTVTVTLTVSNDPARLPSISTLEDVMRRAEFAMLRA